MLLDVIYWHSTLYCTRHAWFPNVRKDWKRAYAAKFHEDGPGYESNESLQEQLDSNLLGTLAYAHRLRLVDNSVGSDEQNVKDGQYSICLTDYVWNVFDRFKRGDRGRPL